jgi:hypothetical protein
MATPSPVFPAAVATDSQLKIANNLVQTSLKVGAGIGDTILFVTSTAGFTANCLVSIDKEIVAIDSVVSAPNASLIVASGGRGFDGTSAAAHSGGAKVSVFMDAWHHNVLSAEVKAIETFLGPNGQNIAGLSYFVISKTYDFAPQQPGGVLTVGSNVITLSPVPKGVNGSDQKHYLYLSGGTGAAEAVLITGGTAVSGAASGTVIVNCANSHTGAWTIKSATAGLQEAIIANGGAGVAVWIPKGTHVMYAPLEVGGWHGLTIQGAGIGSTVLDIAHPTNDLFVASSMLNDFDLRELSVTSSVVRTAGWVFHVNSPYTAYGLLRRARFFHLDVKKQVNGFWIAQFELSQITECWLTNFVGSGGIGIKAGQTTTTNINQGSGLNITDTYIYGNDFVGSDPLQLAYGLWIEDCDAIEVNHMEISGTLTRNVHITSGTGHQSGNHFFNELVSDSCGTGPGFYITGSGISTVLIDACWFVAAGSVPPTTPGAANIAIDSQTALAVQIRNSHIVSAQGNGIRINMPGGSAAVMIMDCYFGQNGQSNTAGSNDTIYINCQNDNLAPFLSGNYDTGAVGASLRVVNANLLQVGDNHWASGVISTSPLLGTRLKGTTGPLGGSALTAGQSVTVTTTVTGAAVNMAVGTTPQVNPGNGFIWRSYVSAPNTVITVLTCIVAGTPAQSGYALALTY